MPRSFLRHTSGLPGAFPAHSPGFTIADYVERDLRLTLARQSGSGSRGSTEDGTRRSFETPVARPQRQSGPMRRCQQMHVHPAEALSSEAMSPEEIEHFSMLDDRRARQRGEQVQYFVPAHQRATSQLTDDEGVRPHRVGFEVAGQAVASISKVIDPDRGDA